MALSVAFVSSCGSGDAEPPIPPESVAAPTFSPAGPLNFGAPLPVTLATPTAGATIRFTLDGSEPTVTSSAYTAPLVLTSTTTVKALAHWGDILSPVATATFTQRPLDLFLDDGADEGAQGCYSDTSQYLMLNRFTPPPDSFAFAVRTIGVRFYPSTPAGSAAQVVVYADADGTPANGAVLLASYDVTVPTDDGSWSEFELPDPAVVVGPGDVLVGVTGRCNKLTWPGPSIYCDRSLPADRTWFGVWGSPPASPELPPAYFELMDASSAGGGCNAMIRASN